jgi:hypothetical protein
MTALFYITITTAFVAYIIHKLGAFPLILDRFRIYEDEPEKVQAPTAEPQRQTTSKETDPQTQPQLIAFDFEQRRKLENIAANILTARGAAFDVWGLVRSLTTSELTKIINDGI